MTTLSDRQRQLLFDYSLGLTSERETEEAQTLIALNTEALDFYQSLQQTLAPLENVELEPCPDELVERLLARVREVMPKEAGEDHSEELLAGERSARPTIRIPLWRNWSEVVAAAAAVVLFVGVLFPAVGRMRDRYQRVQCASNLNGIYNGLRSYVSDHDGLLPAVARAPGAPWWKVGDQGQENHSNTRQFWVLTKQGYVDPWRYFCPARRAGRGLSFEGFKIQNFTDFPSSAYIHFSIRIPCPTSNERDLSCKGVLMADRNPLSERLPSDYSAGLCIQLGEEIVSANSTNHKGRGQNALLYDGSVEFTKLRSVSGFDDDIYLLRSMLCGTEVRGDEFPTTEKDIFLAP